ncbi:glycosyltransferase family 2 protein [Desulfamplus magnetovallimortis]|nr:glycosyltransferase family 2 protein [Desulfamplus magnetovallimortis]
MVKISVYIIAYNQETKIRPALESVTWADEIIVADSFSSDRTAEIAEEYGAKVIQIPFKGFGDLRNKAIFACSHEWIFSLDSDERCTPEARDEILSIIQRFSLHNSDYSNSLSEEEEKKRRSEEDRGKEKDRGNRKSVGEKLHDLYYVPRKNFFMGKWIRHSGYYPDYRQPQLFRKGTLVFKSDPVHERYDIISENRAGRIRSPIHQIPYLTIEEMLAKKNRYSTLGAIKLEKEGKSCGMFTALMHGIWSFIRTYFLKAGFMDGWPGFVIAFGNFEETFYKYVKLYEKNMKLGHLDSNSHGQG